MSRGRVRRLSWVLLFGMTTSAWGAITIDASISRDQGSASTTVTTPAFSTSASNELLLALIATDFSSGTNTTVKSVSGGGLTWVLVRRTNTQSGTAEIWRTFASAPLSGVNVAATLSQSVASSLTVMSFAGVDTSGTSGSGAIGASASGNARSGAPTASLATTRNGSWVVGVGNDFDNAIGRTVGSNQILVHQYLAPVGDTYWVQLQSSPTPNSGTSVTINDTAPTGDRYNMTICEVLAAATVVPTWSISGTVSPTSIGAGATVSLSGASTATTTADPSGNYSFTGLANGTYTVTPSKTGFTFAPPNRSVPVNGSNVTGINFTGQPLPTWSISGTISPTSIGAGATVSLSGASSATTTADPSGNYSFTGLANGTYTVTPSKTGFTFAPPNQSVPVNGSNVTGINFTGQQSAWSISGTISPVSAGAGATVTLSGAATASVTADSTGNYSFPSLANGSYTVTPVNSGSATIAHVGGKSAAPVAVSGVMTISYTPVNANDALIVFAGCRSGSATALNVTANGWTFTPITGLVGPSPSNDQGGAFGAITPNTSPTTITVTFTNGQNCLTDTTILIDEFSGADTTGGKTTFEAFNTSFDPNVCIGAPVTPLSNNAAIWYGCYDNVTGVNGGYTAAQNDGTGDQSEYKILFGGAGTPVNAGFISTGPSALMAGVAIKPANQGGFTFTPPSQNVTINNADVTGVNFTGQSVPTWSISGTISPASIGAGATVTLGGTASASTTADGSGNYSFTGLTNGAYVVTPSKSGSTFTPPSQNVTVNGANVTGVNFAGQAGAITLRQKNVNGNESTGSNISAAFPSNNIAGDFLIVTGTAARGATTITISDTAGNTYLPAIGPVTDTGQDVTAYIWYVPSCKAGPNTITLTPAKPAALEIHISEWSGLSAISPVDGTSSATGTGTNATSGPVTTTVAGDLIFGYTFLLNTASAGPGFTGMSLVNGDLDEFLIQSSSGSIAATFTQTSGTWFALATAFKSGGPPPPTWSISGTISPTSAGAGATVSLTGTSTATATADASGNYTFSGLLSGSYTLTPSKTGFAFTPPNQSVPVNGSNVTGVNFTGQSVPTWSISGTISPTAAGAGATVSLTGTSSSTVTADGSGNYSSPGLVNGTYTVTPAASGYTFTPPNQSVTINGANVTGINFSGQAGTAPLAIDATVSIDNGSGSTTISAAPFSTTSANELLLAFISTDYTSGTNTTVKSVSGAGLTWVLVQRTNVQSGTAEIWRAFSPTVLSSISVTATLSQSVASSLTVMTFTGADPSGTNGSGAIGAVGTGNSSRGAPTASLTTTRNGSWVVGVGNDFDNAISRTPGTSQRVVHQFLASVGDTYWVQIQSATTPTSPTTVTINDTSPTTDRYNLSICEILSASGTSGGGGNPTPPTVSMTAPAPSAVIASLDTLWAQASDAVGVAGVQFLLNGSPLGSEVTTAPYTMTWNTSTVANGSYTLSARARNTSGLTSISSPVTVTVDNSGNPATVGSWSAAVSIPTVAVNLVLLKNNMVLFYEDGASPTVWDYVNGTFTSVPTTADIFCSGHAVLSDGRVLVVGGFGGGSPIGIASAEIFDPTTNTWSAVPNMSFKRWYPTATTLSDGTVLVTAGWQTTDHTNAGIPEVYNPSTNSWTQLTTANNPFETYPFIYQLSDGRVLHVGGSEFAVVTDVLDLNSKTWSVLDPNVVDGGSSSMYLPGKIMKAGSAADSQTVGSSSNTTYVLDTTQPSPTWQQKPSMVYPRSFMNLTTLPDGTVLATGGETDKNGGNIANAVYAAELWSPQTQTWTTMSSMHTPREYHGTALLLPDGRVLVSGMGADFGNVPDEKSAEFFSPPYLFKGGRPTISQAPTQIQNGTNFFVGTPDAANISTVVLIRTGAVTHFFDQNTRYVPLTFQQTTGGLTVTAPSGPTLAPPGYYMLFLVNSSGVPSVAPIVQVQ